MILVDKDIKQYVDSQQLIVSGFKEKNLNGISYDLTMDVMCDEEGKEHREYDLKPGKDAGKNKYSGEYCWKNS